MEEWEGALQRATEQRDEAQRARARCEADAQALQRDREQLQGALRALSAEMQGLQQRVMLGRATALEDVTNAPQRAPDPAAQRRLEKKLARARARARQLAAENQQLMELSNSLRAEREGLDDSMPAPAPAGLPVGPTAPHQPDGGHAASAAAPPPPHVEPQLPATVASGSDSAPPLAVVGLQLPERPRPPPRPKPEQAPPPRPAQPAASMARVRNYALRSAEDDAAGCC